MWACCWWWPWCWPMAKRDGLGWWMTSLSEVICYRCDKPLGTNRTLVFDAEGDKRYSRKGKWRHGECREEISE